MGSINSGFGIKQLQSAYPPGVEKHYWFQARGLIIPKFYVNLVLLMQRFWRLAVQEA